MYSVSDHDSDDMDNADHKPIKRIRSKSCPKFKETKKVSTSVRSKKERSIIAQLGSEDLDIEEANRGRQKTLVNSMN